MKNKKKKLSGFTLVELIVVMAIFSGIAVGALAMVRPAMSLFNRTSSQEDAGANIDNIGRYIQDQLKFADRVNIYVGFKDEHGNAIATKEDMVKESIVLREEDVIQDDGTVKKEKIGILPVLNIDQSSPNYLQYEYKPATPYDFFKKYYYKSVPDWLKIRVMEIDTNGMVTQSCIKLAPDEPDFTSEAWWDKKMNESFCDPKLGIRITDFRRSLENNATLEMKMEAEYQSSRRDSSGKMVGNKIESLINVTFVNIALRSEVDVIEEYTLPEGAPDTTKPFTTGTGDYDEVERSGNTFTRKTSPAFKLFCPQNYDYKDDPQKIFIFYSVPDIVNK